MKPKAVFFDVGNTLLFPSRQKILAPLHERKIFPDEALLRELERNTKQEFDGVMEHGGRPDHGFWHLFYTHLLDELGVADSAVRDVLVKATHDSANWDNMRPGTGEALERIGRQYRIGVISNADGKIVQALERCGIAKYFPSITDSGVIGREKPDPAIFAAALKDLGARPEESLYVGDVYSVDYLGATRAGMEAVLFDVAGAYREKPVPRVESLAELERRLGS